MNHQEHNSHERDFRVVRSAAATAIESWLLRLPTVIGQDDWVPRSLLLQIYSACHTVVIYLRLKSLGSEPAMDLQEQLRVMEHIDNVAAELDPNWWGAGLARAALQMDLDGASVSEWAYMVRDHDVHGSLTEKRRRQLAVLDREPIPPDVLEALSQFRELMDHRIPAKAEN